MEREAKGLPGKPAPTFTLDLLDGGKLDLAMHKDKEIGRLYQVTGIPQTVLIANDGDVAAVHVGYLPGSEKNLQRELDAILSGKKPVSEAKKD